MSYIWGQLPTLSPFSASTFILLHLSPPVKWLTEAVSHHHEGTLVTRSGRQQRRPGLWLVGGTRWPLGVLPPSRFWEFRVLQAKQTEPTNSGRCSGLGGQENNILATAVPVSLSGERQQDNTVIKTEMRPSEDWLERL